MLARNVYILYTARRHYRAKYICLVLEGFLIVPTSVNKPVSINSHGELGWYSRQLPAGRLKGPFALLRKGATIAHGGRKLAQLNLHRQ